MNDVLSAYENLRITLYFRNGSRQLRTQADGCFKGSDRRCRKYIPVIPSVINLPFVGKERQHRNGKGYGEADSDNLNEDVVFIPEQEA